MDKEIKEDWLEDLRSGEFVQGRDAFYYGNKHCCIAVLAETMGLSLNDDKASDDRDGNFAPEDLFEEDVCELSGIPPKVSSKLISLNDNKGATFEEIADYIEVYL